MNAFEIIGAAFVGGALGFVAGATCGYHLDRKSDFPMATLIAAPIGAVAGAVAGVAYAVVIS